MERVTEPLVFSSCCGDERSTEHEAASSSAAIFKSIGNKGKASRLKDVLRRGATVRGQIPAGPVGKQGAFA